MKTILTIGLAVMLGVVGCAHHQSTQAECEMMQICSLGFSHLQISKETDIRKQFSHACMGFFGVRQRWPGSVAELKEFWAFAPPKPYDGLWVTFHDATLVELADGTLSVETPDGTQKIMILRPKNTEVFR